MPLDLTDHNLEDPCAALQAQIAAYALAVLLALLGWNIALQKQVAEQSAQLARARQSWQTMIVLLNDPAVQWYTIGTGPAQGHFWTDPKSTNACFVIQGLPQLADDRT